MAVELPRTIITPDSLTRPRGYSHAVLTEMFRRDGMVVAHLSLAGQTGSGKDGKILRPGDIVGQTEDTLRNMKAVTDEVGVPLSVLTGVNMYVASVPQFQAVEREIGALWKDHFGGYYPPTTLFEAARLYDGDALIELQGEGFVQLGFLEYAVVREKYGLLATTPVLD